MMDSRDPRPDEGRIRVLAVAIGIALAAIVARLWYLQVVKAPDLALQSESQQVRIVRKVAARGDILDAKGRMLAGSRSHFVVSVIPAELRSHPEKLARLARMIGASTADLAALIRASESAPFDPVPVASDVDRRLLTQIEEQKLDLAGVVVTQDPVRNYPYGPLCAHVVGVTRPVPADRLQKLRGEGYRAGDMIGVEGLECRYESDLRGKDGGQRVVVDARGRLQRDLDTIQPQPGRTLKLAIDYDVQKTAYDALHEALAQGHPGSLVALDPRDGSVLALVSEPSYDPNRYGKDYASLLQDARRPLIDRATASHYPSGSTFKLVTAAAGLATGTTTPTTGDYCSGSLSLGRFVFHCDKRSGHGHIVFPDALGKSCDVYFWHVAQRAGAENLIKWARRFGLGARTGIDLPVSVDGKGIVPSPEWKEKHGLGPWRPGDLLNMAIGQGYVGVTPLQLADYTAAIANGGSLMRPQIVREIDDVSGGQVRATYRMRPDVQRQLGLAPDLRAAIVDGMERAMKPGGTAAGSALPGLLVAGKTGSAEAITHGRKTTHSVFTCFAPADNPRIVVSVLVEGGGHGADTAAPIARRILNRYFHLHLDDSAVPIGRTFGGD